MPYWAHDSAIVDQPASVGDGTKIWHFSHVMTGARIGARCSLGQNVFVGARVTVGDGCKIQNNVSLYDAVELGPEVFIGPSAVFTNVINPRAFIERKTEYLPTKVARGATIGANATVVCGCTVGEYAFVGAGAVVTRDIPPYALALGVPARVVDWVCKCGSRLASAGAEQERACSDCGQRYRLLREKGGPRLTPVLAGT